MNWSRTRRVGIHMDQLITLVVERYNLAAANYE
jgi:hypothetical protein